MHVMGSLILQAVFRYRTVCFFSSLILLSVCFFDLGRVKKMFIFFSSATGLSYTSELTIHFMSLDLCGLCY